MRLTVLFRTSHLERFRQQQALCAAQIVFQQECQETEKAGEAHRIQRMSVDQAQLEIELFEVGRIQQLALELQREQLDALSLEIDGERNKLVAQKAEVEQQRQQVQVDREALEKSKAEVKRSNAQKERDSGSRKQRQRS